MRWTLVADAGFRQLGIEPGDVVTVEPGAAEPILIHRPAPVNFGAILTAIELDALRPLHPREPLVSALSALLLPPPPAAPVPVLYLDRAD